MIAFDRGWSNSTFTLPRFYLFQILFATVKTKIKGKVVFPVEIRDAVRDRWPDENAGQFDAQHQSSGRLLKLEELLAYEWGSCHCI